MLGLQCFRRNWFGISWEDPAGKGLLLTSGYVLWFSSIAAVSALAKFGAQNENLLPSVLVLLQR